MDALHAGGATTVSSTGSSTKAWRTPRKIMAANSHRNTRPVSNGAQTSGCQQCRTQTQEHEVTKWSSRTSIPSAVEKAPLKTEEPISLIARAALSRGVPPVVMK